MKYSSILLPDDLQAVKAVAESSFVSTPDSSLEEWFSFDQMQMYIAEGRGVCLKAVSDEGEVGWHDLCTTRESHKWERRVG